MPEDISHTTYIKVVHTTFIKIAKFVKPHLSIIPSGAILSLYAPPGLDYLPCMDARQGMTNFCAHNRPEEAIADPAPVPGTVLPSAAAAAAPAGLRWRKLDLAATPGVPVALLPAGSAEPAALPPAVAAAAGAASAPRSDAAHALDSSQHRIAQAKALQVHMSQLVHRIKEPSGFVQPLPASAILPFACHPCYREDLLPVAAL